MTALLALLKLVPLKDWLYVFAISALLVSFAWYTHHERQIGASKLQAAVTQESAKAEANNTKRLKDLTDQHSNDVAVIEENYETILKDSDAQHISDLDRLRKYASDSGKTHEVLGSSSCNSSEADSWRERFEGLGQISAELADAIRRDDAALKSCYAERDSLTGK